MVLPCVPDCPSGRVCFQGYRAKLSELKTILKAKIVIIGFAISTITVSPSFKKSFSKRVHKAHHNVFLRLLARPKDKNYLNSLTYYSHSLSEWINKTLQNSFEKI